jgi:hypothetical protein
VQDDLIPHNVVSKTVVTDPETELPLAAGNVYELSYVRAAAQVVRVLFEQFYSVEERLVDPWSVLA